MDPRDLVTKPPARERFVTWNVVKDLVGDPVASCCDYAMAWAKVQGVRLKYIRFSDVYDGQVLRAEITGETNG